MNATMEQPSKTRPDSAQEYLQHLDAVHRYLRALVAIPADAEDLTQEVFRKAAQNWPGIRQGDVRGWLFTTARNEAMQYYRRRGTEKRNMSAFQALFRGSGSTETVPDETETRQMHDAAQAVIATLEPQEREAIRMKFVLALSNAEIASALNVTPNHLGVLLFRALKKVRQKLETSAHE